MYITGNCSICMFLSMYTYTLISFPQEDVITLTRQAKIEANLYTSGKTEGLEPLVGTHKSGEAIRYERRLPGRYVPKPATSSKENASLNGPRPGRAFERLCVGLLFTMMGAVTSSVRNLDWSLWMMFRCLSLLGHLQRLDIECRT